MPWNPPAAGPAAAAPPVVAPVDPRVASRAPAPQMPPMEICHEARIIALVGNEAVLMSDLRAAAENAIERAAKKMSAEEIQVQREMLHKGLATAIEEAVIRTDALTQEQRSRRELLEQMLKQMIESKLVYLDARQSIPKEAFPNVETQVFGAFEQSEVKKLMTKAGATSRRELDLYLRERGSSFEREKKAFLEQAVTQQWIREQVNMSEEVTVAQMLQYYHDHSEEFDRPAETRWQMLAAPFSRYVSKAEAYATIARMGNQVLAGANFESVARSGADEGAESDGSISSWTDGPARPGAPKYASPPSVVEPAIKGLSAGQMSPIVEDYRGYYIVRVVERIPASRISFEEAQAEIREKVKTQRASSAIEKYLADLRKRFPIWTVLDGGQPGMTASTR